MRIWTLHPQYLDPQGLVALWRETLLAQKVLLGETRGYQSHLQLVRFRAQKQPLIAIGAYLLEIHQEALRRGYNFNRTKIVHPQTHPLIEVNTSQVDYEWQHLMNKLRQRNPNLYEQLHGVETVAVHPLFKLIPGPIENWERA